MKTPPRSGRFKTMQIKRVDFLINTHQRLRDDVGTILKLIDSHNLGTFERNDRSIGYWASLRMILPIIEAVAHVMGTRPQQLLGRHLHIATPNLMWDLFRHSLTHGDILQEGTYKGKNVTWGTGFGMGGHVTSSGYIGIDITVLYEDLASYLQQEIANNDQTMVEVETGVEYGVTGEPKDAIISEFSKL